MVTNQTNEPNMIQKKFESYYDIDGISIVLSNAQYVALKKSIHDIILTINHKELYGTRISNNSKIKFDNLMYIKKQNYIFLSEIPTAIGRKNVFIIFNDHRFDTNTFFKKIKNLFIQNKASYLLYTENTKKYFNISLSEIFSVFTEIEREYNISTYLYGENFRNKYILLERKLLKEFINEQKIIFNIPLYKMDYIEIDICKNISITNDSKYMTLIELRKSVKYQKNFLIRLTSNKIYEYNVLNQSKLKDYHSNNTNINLSNIGIEINKINLYNPTMNNICNGLYT